MVVFRFGAEDIEPIFSYTDAVNIANAYPEQQPQIDYWDGDLRHRNIQAPMEQVVAQPEPITELTNEPTIQTSAEDGDGV